jgi:hypothetical protein
MRRPTILAAAAVLGVAVLALAAWPRGVGSPGRGSAVDRVAREAPPVEEESEVARRAPVSPHEPAEALQEQRAKEEAWPSESPAPAPPLRLACAPGAWELLDPSRALWTLAHARGVELALAADADPFDAVARGRADAALATDLAAARARGFDVIELGVLVAAFVVHRDRVLDELPRATLERIAGGLPAPDERYASAVDLAGRSRPGLLADGAVRALVLRDPGLLGLVALPAAGPPLRVLPVDGVLPSAQAVRSGAYPFGRVYGVALPPGPAPGPTPARNAFARLLADPTARGLLGARVSL